MEKRNWQSSLTRWGVQNKNPHVAWKWEIIMWQNNGITYIYITNCILVITRRIKFTIRWLNFSYLFFFSLCVLQQSAFAIHLNAPTAAWKWQRPPSQPRWWDAMVPQVLGAIVFSMIKIGGCRTVNWIVTKPNQKMHKPFFTFQLCSWASHQTLCGLSPLDPAAIQLLARP